jgi:hypothetical protein
VATRELHSDVRAETLKVSAAEARRITAIFEIQAAAGQVRQCSIYAAPHTVPCESIWTVDHAASSR